jgi:hypothetical protein
LNLVERVVRGAGRAQYEPRIAADRVARAAIQIGVPFGGSRRRCEQQRGDEGDEKLG